jgi:hypothetical protein
MHHTHWERSHNICPAKAHCSRSEHMRNCRTLVHPTRWHTLRRILEDYLSAGRAFAVWLITRTRPKSREQVEARNPVRYPRRSDQNEYRTSLKEPPDPCNSSTPRVAALSPGFPPFGTREKITASTPLLYLGPRRGYKPHGQSISLRGPAVTTSRPGASGEADSSLGWRPLAVVLRYGCIGIPLYWFCIGGHRGIPHLDHSV